MAGAGSNPEDQKGTGRELPESLYRWIWKKIYIYTYMYMYTHIYHMILNYVLV